MEIFVITSRDWKPKCGDTVCAYHITNKISPFLGRLKIDYFVNSGVIIIESNRVNDELRSSRIQNYLLHRRKIVWYIGYYDTFSSSCRPLVK